MLVSYATTKGAIQNFTGGLAQMLAERHPRQSDAGSNLDASGPPTMPDDAVKNFGKQVTMKRPGQPAECATAYVMLADSLSSFTYRNDGGDHRWQTVYLTVADLTDRRFRMSTE
jgi:NAD(P)-dependent dehydrogenase (short-subunit alcohol dehydrogenase family)